MNPQNLTLKQLIEQQFGVQTDTSIVSVSVGTTAIQLAPNNPNRVGLVIMNLSGNDVYISPFSGVSSTNGLKLATSGGSITLNWQYDLTFCGYGFQAVASGANSSVLVLEVFTISQAAAGEK